jgi:hypothetical protein
MWRRCLILGLLAACPAEEELPPKGSSIDESGHTERQPGSEESDVGATDSPAPETDSDPETSPPPESPPPEHTEVLPVDSQVTETTEPIPDETAPLPVESGIADTMGSTPGESPHAETDIETDGAETDGSETDDSETHASPDTLSDSTDLTDSLVDSTPVQPDTDAHNETDETPPRDSSRPDSGHPVPHSLIAEDSPATETAPAETDPAPLDTDGGLLETAPPHSSGRVDSMPDSDSVRETLKTDTSPRHSSVVESGPRHTDASPPRDTHADSSSDTSPEASTPPHIGAPDSAIDESHPVVDTVAADTRDTETVFDSDLDIDTGLTLDSELPADSGPVESNNPVATGDSGRSPHTWPIAPRCLFRNDGVYTSPVGFRSIDFDYAAGSGFAMFGNFTFLDDGDTVPEISVHIGISNTYGESVFLVPPSGGDIFYTNLTVGAIRRDAIRTNTFVKRHGYLDLDLDGRADYVLRASTTVDECLGFRSLPIEQSVSNYTWRFFDSEIGGEVLVCDHARINDDDIEDLNIRYEVSPTLTVDRWYLGPFSPGEVDLAGRAFLEARTRTRGELAFDAYGDFNGDGRQDFAQTWYGLDQRGGELLIWFGPLGGVLDLTSPDLTIRSQANSPLFMFYQVDNLGDIDGDGTDDIGVATAEDFNGSYGSGAVYIFKGPLRPGPPLVDTDADAIIHWPSTLARTGHTLVPLGDVDGDERADFSVGVWADADRMPAGFPRDVLWPPPPQPFHRSPEDTWPDTGPTDSPSGPPAPTGPYPPAPPGFSYSGADGAIMVFGDVPYGVIGPEAAKFTIMGSRPTSFIGHVGVIGPGDLDGDGLADIAFSGDPYGIGVHAHVVYPCTDFGTRVSP